MRRSPTFPELCEFDIRAAVDFRDGEGASRPLAVLVRR